MPVPEKVIAEVGLTDMLGAPLQGALGNRVADNHWSVDAIEALKVAVRHVDNTKDGMVPSWYVMALGALAKYKKAQEPLPEWLDWQMMQRGP